MKFVHLLIIGAIAAIIEGSPVTQNSSDGHAQFAADVYKGLLKSNSGNFLVCPLSVEIVLALAHSGAKGSTAQQISSALHLPEDKQAVQKIFQELTPTLKGNKEYNLNSANKIYVKEGFKVNEEFKQVAVNAFQSEVENIDFLAKSEAASKMNKWVEEKTHDKIKNLLSADDLNEYTRLILINAIYFHGKWVSPFSKEATSKKPFHTSKSKESEIDIMELTKRFNYYENSELKAKFLELPYEGEDITMTLVLPNEIEGLASLEENIADVLKVPSYQYERVQVQIPKFKIETKIEFKDILKKLGIELAFSDDADFSNLVPPQGEPLKIAKVVQKAFIEVAEEGTTAAAATAAIIEVIRSSHALVGPLKEFNADHPFIYYLKSPAGILFVGRYVE